MSLESNMSFTSAVNTENKLSLSVAQACSEGQYFLRTNVFEIVHNAGLIVPHPQYANLLRNGQNHLLTKGSCTLSFAEIPDWNAWDEYYEWMAQDTPNAVVSTSGDKIIVEWSVSYDQLEWSQLRALYSPISGNAKIEVSEGSDFACFMRIDGEPDAWTVRYKDIPAGTESIIENQGNHCYVFFSTDVQKGDTTLTAYKHYKLTSNEITVIAAENTKVVRMSRD